MRSPALSRRSVLAALGRRGCCSCGRRGCRTIWLSPCRKSGAALRHPEHVTVGGGGGGRVLAGSFCSLAGRALPSAALPQQPSLRPPAPSCVSSSCESPVPRVPLFPSVMARPRRCRGRLKPPAVGSHPEPGCLAAARRTATRRPGSRQVAASRGSERGSPKHKGAERQRAGAG